MSETGETQEETETETEHGTEDLTPRRAFELWNPDGSRDLSYREIASMYDTSHSTVRRRVTEYQEARDHTVNEVKENPGAFDLGSVIADSEPDSTPFDSTCPACKSPIPTPKSAGVHGCPECGEELEWKEDEI